MKKLLCMFLILFLSGCSAKDVREYEGTTPSLDLFAYFKGNTKGWGIVQDRLGNLTRQFVVDVHGSIDQNGTLVLEEEFRWRNGEKSTRVWRIDKTAEREFIGTADDVIGQASGSAAGNVLNWKYSLNLEVDGSTWKITFNDWMFLQPDGVLLNKAAMTKFGFKVGEVTISFQKQNM